MYRQVSEVMHRAYRPYGSLHELLGALVNELSRHQAFRGSTLHLQRRASAGTPRVPRDTAARDPAHGQTTPIRYAGELLGELHLEGGSADTVDSTLGLREVFARRCAHLIKRYEAQSWADARLRRPVLLVGVCDALGRVDAFVEKAAHSHLPVLLRGEFGTEKMEVAVALHSCGPLREGPFIEINCADPPGDPASWFEQAAGGTLYLDAIDELPPHLQAQLPQRIQPITLAPERHSRVVASTSQDLEACVREGRFARALLAGLAFLVGDVPPLRERPGDIAALVSRTLERYGFDPQRALTDELLDVLRRHRWPENLLEMERVVARLAVMTGGRPIRAADIQLHAPALAAALPVAGGGAGSARAAGAAGAEAMPAPGGGRRDSDWVTNVLALDRTGSSDLHDALRKALVYMSEHFAEPLVLADLARQAHVSQSHLGFLFRSELGVTFKPLLQRMRIGKAKELLRASLRPRITDIALQVGFGDLSHFEKTFRRVVGVSPRAFRRLPPA